MTIYGTHIDTLLSPDRISNLIKFSNYAAPLGGYMAEFGCYRGGSLEILAKHNPCSNIFGIDSFDGLPKASEHDFHREGDFADVDFHATAGFFKIMYPNVRLVKGFSPAVFSFFDAHSNFCFAHIDVDLYQSVLDGLDFFVPRMRNGGIILLDDYKQNSTPGCEKAINDFLSRAEITISHSEELKFWNSETSESHKQFLIVK